MFQVKRALSKKDQLKILFLLDELKSKDLWRDFYLTKERNRLFIIENPDVLFKSLKKGNVIVFNDKGLLIVTGYADKKITIFDYKIKEERIINTRKYLKILAQDEKTMDKLIKVLSWNLNTELWAKIKINNPVKNVLEKNGFYKALPLRGKEIVLKRNKINVVMKKSDKE